MRGLTARRPADGATTRRRTLVPTLLLVMLALMIVRDIVVRRWTTAPGPATDVSRTH